MRYDIEKLIEWFNEMFEEWRSEYVSYCDPDPEVFKNRAEIVSALKLLCSCSPSVYRAEEWFMEAVSSRGEKDGDVRHMNKLLELTKKSGD